MRVTVHPAFQILSVLECEYSSCLDLESFLLEIGTVHAIGGGIYAFVAQRRTPRVFLVLADRRLRWLLAPLPLKIVQ